MLKNNHGLQLQWVWTHEDSRVSLVSKLFCYYLMNSYSWLLACHVIPLALMIITYAVARPHSYNMRYNTFAIQIISSCHPWPFEINLFSAFSLSCWVSCHYRDSLEAGKEMLGAKTLMGLYRYPWNGTFGLIPMQHPILVVPWDCAQRAESLRVCPQAEKSSCCCLYGCSTTKVKFCKESDAKRVSASALALALNAYMKQRKYSRRQPLPLIAVVLSICIRNRIRITTHIMPIWSARTPLICHALVCTF